MDLQKIGLVGSAAVVVISLVLLIFSGSGDHPSSYHIFIIGGSIVFGCRLISDAIIKTKQ